MGMIDAYAGSPGANTLHEVTESYKAGKFTQLLNVGFVGSATQKDLNNPFSIFSLSHNSVTKQVPQEGYDYEFYDKTGNSTNSLQKGGKAIYFITDPAKKKERLIFQTYP